MYLFWPLYIWITYPLENILWNCFLLCVLWSKQKVGVCIHSVGEYGSSEMSIFMLIANGIWLVRLFNAITALPRTPKPRNAFKWGMTKDAGCWLCNFVVEGRTNSIISQSTFSLDTYTLMHFNKIQTRFSLIRFYNL